MHNTSVELKSLPRFSTDTEGRPTAVTLDTATYVKTSTAFTVTYTCAC